MLTKSLQQEIQALRSGRTAFPCFICGPETRRQLFKRVFHMLLRRQTIEIVLCWHRDQEAASCIRYRQIPSEWKSCQTMNFTDARKWQRKLSELFSLNGSNITDRIEQPALRRPKEENLVSRAKTHPTIAKVDCQPR